MEGLSSTGPTPSSFIISRDLYVSFCICASIRIGQEIWCLPYMGFKKKKFLQEMGPGTEINTSKNTSTVNVKILMTARLHKALTKGTQNGTRYMIQESLGFKMVVLTNNETKTNEDHEQLKVKVEDLGKPVQAMANTNQDNEQLQEKLEVLDKVVQAMIRKVFSLETELKEVKKKSILLFNVYED